MIIDILCILHYISSFFRSLTQNSMWVVLVLWLWHIHFIIRLLPVGWFGGHIIFAIDKVDWLIDWLWLLFAAGHTWLLGSKLDHEVTDTDQYLFTRFRQKWDEIGISQQSTYVLNCWIVLLFFQDNCFFLNLCKNNLCRCCVTVKWHNYLSSLMLLIRQQDWHPACKISCSNISQKFEFWTRLSHEKLAG